MAELEIKPTPTMILRVTGVIGSAGTLIAVIVWLLTGGGVGLFARKVDVKTYIPDATGLAVGAPVRLNGIQVGAVRNIAISGYLDTQRAVRIGLRLETIYLASIPSDSLTSIGSDTLIGEKFLDIEAGKNAATIVDGSELRSEPADSAADKADLIYGLQQSLRKVDGILAGVASQDTPLGHYVMGDKEYNQAIGVVDAFEKSLRGLVAPENLTADAVFSPALFAKWDKSIRQIDDTLQGIQKGEGSTGHLFVSDEQYNTVLTQVRDLRRSVAQARADIAKAGPGLRDETAYQNLTRLLKSTDAMISALNRGEGSAGQLLTNPQLYESLLGSLKNLDDFLKDFRGNPKKYLRAKVF